MNINTVSTVPGPERRKKRGEEREKKGWGIKFFDTLLSPEISYQSGFPVLQTPRGKEKKRKGA